METWEKIRRRRSELGLTQRAAADAMGMNPVQYNGYENGRHEPSDENMALIANVLKISPDELWGDAFGTNDSEPFGLTIAQAKRGLAKTFGVTEDQVQITISG